MLDAGDIKSQLVLDRTQFDQALMKALADLTAAMKKLGSSTKRTARGMSADMDESARKTRAAFGMTSKVAQQTSKEMGESVTKFGKKSAVASEKVQKGWWKTFGSVAIGFTIAYRAMNALEAGMRKYADTVRDAIVESGELASIQAKLAFWFKMHSEAFITYNDAFAKAAVNTRALMRANMTAISSLAELSTGLDEVAQAVGAIPARLIPALADTVDFTVMVAQTTGSTIRQVRQELQALMQGQVRTTNILIRALKNLRVITDEDISNLKGMTNRAEIFEKVLGAISEHWSKVREKLISTDVNIAMRFWEKSIRAVLTQSVMLASELENVGNIFAMEFAKRGREAAGVLDGEVSEAVRRNIVLMQRLRDVLGFGLDAFDWVVEAAGYLATAMTNLSGPLKTAAKILTGYLAFGAIGKILRGLGAAILWLATGPMKILIKAANAVYLRFLLIPAVISAAAISVEVLLDMLDQRIPDVKEKTTSWLSDTAEATKEATRGFIDLAGSVQLIADAYKYWGEKIKGAPEAIGENAKKAAKEFEGLGKAVAGFGVEFGKRFAEKTKSHFEIIAKTLEPIFKSLSGMMDDLFKPPEWEDKAEEAGEGLGWAFAMKWDETTMEILEKGMERWFKAIEKLQKEVDKGAAKSAKSLDAIVNKWLSNTEKAAEEAIASLTELNSLWEGELIDTETYERGIDFVVEKYKKAIKEMKEETNEFAEVTKKALSDLFTDALTGKLESFGDYWQSFWQGMVRIFVDNFIKKIEIAWMAAQAKMKAAELAGGAATGAGGLMAAAGPALAGLAALYAVYSIGRSQEKKRHAEEEARKRALEALANAWDDVFTQVLDIINPLDEVSKALDNVNKRFNEWKSSLASLGATTSELTRLEELRVEALEATRQRLFEEFTAPLEDIIAKIDLAPTDYARRELSLWYQEQIDSARALGTEAVKLLREAYELSKQQLILEQQAVLTGIQEEATGIIATMGMSPMEMQLYNLIKWQESMDAATDAIREEMDKIPGIIQDYVSEIAGLESDYDAALAAITGAGTDFDAMVALTAERFSFLAETYGPQWWADFVSKLEQGILDVFPAEIVGEPAASWKRMFDTAWTEYQRLLLEAEQQIDTIPGEIDLINEAIAEQEALLADLAEQLTETGGAVAEAYLLQLEALKTQFFEGLEKIIRSHTLSDYEQGLYDLNQWYYEQLAVMEALGIQTDLLTQAYNLQRQALLETALDSSDLVDELEKWQQVLWKLKDQIMEIQFSLQNPMDVLERMTLLEGEITRMLGDTWQQGILATEGMAAETVEKSSELLGKYLDMAADAFQRPSIEYQEIYGDVLDALMGLEEYAQEQVTDLEIQLEQLEAQLKMVQLLETIVADQVPVIPPSDKTEPVLDGLIGGTPYDPELYKTALSLPELQEGTDYVPRTGPYILHEGEKVTPYGEDGMSISITVNESATPHETAREVKNEFFRLLRSDAGRKEVQQASRGR